MIHYKLLIKKTNGEIIQLGKSDKDLNKIKDRQNNFLKAKIAGLRPLYTTHTKIIKVITKKGKGRKKGERHPVGTTVTVTTKPYFRTYNGIRKLIKPHKINMGGKYKKKR